MKLRFVEISGFRGYRKPVRIEFGEQFTILDGRNGVGKSTVFDAVEFALTGQLSKYNDAKASGETVSDYIWWTGSGDGPKNRYVEVGFSDGAERYVVHRSNLGASADSDLQGLSNRLCDPSLAPSDSLIQLCASSIIRDEHITTLSLDMKEAERYGLLRDALGANEAEKWISRGAKLKSLAEAKRKSAENEVAIANGEVSSNNRRLDEVRARLLSEATVSQAAERLRVFSQSNASADQLSSPVREQIARNNAQVEALTRLQSESVQIQELRHQIPALNAAAKEAAGEADTAASELDAANARLTSIRSSSSLNTHARTLLTLAEAGRSLGLRDGHCPLCDADRTREDFEAALIAAEALARRLDADAADAQLAEQARSKAEERLANATRRMALAESTTLSVNTRLQKFNDELRAFGLAEFCSATEINNQAQLLRQNGANAQQDLHVLETLRLNAELERVTRSAADAATRLAKAQDKFGRARKAESSAQALFDASRRASSETLDLRLERVLPLLSEIYRRLRPHPVWSDIEYSIRGDVKRFMTLRVGEELNPQFLFSSGQRRATGLAFLLAVNLSLAWSRWRTIMLDDPVQHIDDFRAVHLAEVVAQLVGEGRQVICAVEDAALADLLCRRLPVSHAGSANRVTLGADAEGALAVVSNRLLNPLPIEVLLPGKDRRAG